MLAIVGEQVITRLHASAQADAGGFFAQVEVAVAANSGSLIHLGRFFLEAADQQHLPVKTEHFVGVSFGHNRRFGRAAARFACYGSAVGHGRGT